MPYNNSNLQEANICTKCTSQKGIKTGGTTIPKGNKISCLTRSEREPQSSFEEQENPP